ncbi:hypothetical protein [Taibaiella chishuiensis]|nr:hypothetical protein [Taibaiella chishuiensis]
MKCCIPILVLLLLPCISVAQKSNPFKSIGKTAKVQTLSNGKYVESFDDELLQRVGTVVINRRTKKIVEMLDADKVNNESADNSTASRWYSIDPMAEKFYSQSPYSFAGNNPVYYVDIAGALQYPASDAKKFTDKYPNLTSYLVNNIQNDVMTSPNMLKAMSKYSEGNLTTSQVKKDMQWGEKTSPTIVFSDGYKVSEDGRSGVFGEYTEQNNTINISAAFASKVEGILAGKGTTDEKTAALFEFLGTVTHEEVHRGDYLDGKRQEATDKSGWGKEPGNAYTSDVFESQNVDGNRIPIGLGIHGDSKELLQIQKNDGRTDLVPTLPNPPKK